MRERTGVREKESERGGKLEHRGRMVVFRRSPSITVILQVTNRT